MTMEKDIEREAMDEVQRPLIVHINGKEDKSHGSNDDKSIWSWTVFFSTIVAVMGSFEFGSCVGYTAPTQSAISEDLNLSVAEFSLFGSILTIGGMIGAIASGRIADHFGRKGALGMSTFSSIVGWIAIYFSKGCISLDIGRFLSGYGIGVFSYVVPIYIAEIAPKNLRGGLAALNQLMIVIGATTAVMLGTVITWRQLALTGIIPCIVLLLGLAFIPESPRWLAKVGKQKECESSLRILRGKDVDISDEAAEIQEYIQSLKQIPKAGILDLLQPRYSLSLVIGVGLMFLQQFGGANGIGFYASQTLVSAGFPSAKFGIMLFACIQVPITAAGAILLDRSGRKPLLLVSSTGTFFGCFLAGTAFFMKDRGLVQQLTPYLVLAGMLLYTGSFSIGMGAVPWVLMSEVFPINVKGAAGSLVNLVHWFVAWIISYTYSFLFDWSSAGIFYLYAAVCGLTVIFVAKLVPETKGRTLEEIQASLNNTKEERL